MWEFVYATILLYVGSPDVFMTVALDCALPFKCTFRSGLCMCLWRQPDSMCVYVKCAGGDCFTPADYKCVIICFILGMNVPICLQWVFLHHNKTEKHTHIHTHRPLYQNPNHRPFGLIAVRRPLPNTRQPHWLTGYLVQSVSRLSAPHLSENCSFVLLFWFSARRVKYNPARLPRPL